MLIDDNTTNGYKIEDVKRINIRYYLIKITGKFYIIDYSDPKDIRNYFSFFVLGIHNQWRIYEVTGNEATYGAKRLSLYQSQDKKYEWIALILVALYWFNRRSGLRLRDLTYDVRIVQYWQLTILLIVVVMFTLCILLYSQKTKIPLPEDSYILKRKTPTLLKHVVQAYLFFLPVVILGLGLGVLFSNYADLLFLGVLLPFSLLFMKFGSFLTPTNTYQIIDEKNISHAKERS